MINFPEKGANVWVGKTCENYKNPAFPPSHKTCAFDMSIPLSNLATAYNLKL